MTDRNELLDPATPPDRLAALIQQFCGEDVAFQNPSLPLLLLAEPAFPRRFPDWVLEQLAARAGCPEAFAVHMLEVERCRLPLLGNRSVPLGLRRQAFLRMPALDDWTDHRDAIAEVLTPDELDLLRRAGVDEDTQDALTVADLERLAELGADAISVVLDHPLTPGPLLVRLYEEKRSYASFLAPEHPNAPLDFLARLLASDDLMERCDAAASPHLSAAQLLALVQDPEPELRRAVADNPALTPALAVQLAQDLDPDVRSSVAPHPALPLEWLERLAASPDDADRRGAARSLRLSAATMLRLAEDPNGYVISALRQNPSLTDEVREVLGHD